MIGRVVVFALRSIYSGRFEKGPAINLYASRVRSCILRVKKQANSMAIPINSSIFYHTTSCGERNEKRKELQSGHFSPDFFFFHRMLWEEKCDERKVTLFFCFLGPRAPLAGRKIGKRLSSGTNQKQKKFTAGRKVPHKLKATHLL